MLVRSCKRCELVPVVMDLQLQYLDRYRKQVVESEGIGEMQDDSVAYRGRGTIQNQNGVNIGRIHLRFSLDRPARQRHASGWEEKSRSQSKEEKQRNRIGLAGSETRTEKVDDDKEIDRSNTREC